MSNSDGETLKPTKRKARHRDLKKSAKVENLVSKTFQAKLTANQQSLQSTSTTSIKVNFTKNSDIETKPEFRVENLTANETNITMIQQSQPIKTREEIKAEKKAKKLAKKAKKMDQGSQNIEEGTIQTCSENENCEGKVAQATNEKSQLQTNEQMIQQSQSIKTKEEINAENKATKLSKKAKKKNKASQNIKESTIQTCSENGNGEGKVSQATNKNPQLQNNDQEYTKETSINPPIDTKSIEKKMGSVNISASDNNSEERPKVQKQVLTKAERRAIQEAQRAAKAAGTKAVSKAVTISNSTNEKKPPNGLPKENSSPRVDKPLLKSSKDCRVKLFNHLESSCKDSNLFANNLNIHPIIVRLGEQYAKRTIVGSNARCISFLSALKKVIQDYETPAKKEFARSLETNIKNCVDHLHKCRPLAVSVSNAYKHIKHVLTQLSVDQPESELKEHLCHFIDTYIENQIGKAAEAISRSVQDKILDGDVILTFGCSSLINYIFEEAHRRKVDFRVIVVDSRPFLEGQELLRRLTASEIPCTYVLINAVGFVMPEATKILLGAHALLSNGYVMARAGTAQVALVARSFNVPVLVCCETHKFSERFQTDAIVYNELGNPDDLIMSNKCRLMNWQSQNKLSPLNLNYDITPPELVTAVVTEVAILPCTSVPVILRIKPTEIGY